MGSCLWSCVSAVGMNLAWAGEEFLYVNFLKLSVVDVQHYTSLCHIYVYYMYMYVCIVHIYTCIYCRDSQIKIELR